MCIYQIYNTHITKKTDRPEGGLPLSPAQISQQAERERDKDRVCSVLDITSGESNV